MATVSIRDLALSYGDFRVFQAMNLDVAEGEFLVLLGPSGCGKSTLLNSIAGLVDVSGGEVRIGERNVTWEEPKDRAIGMVFQSYALYPHMTVERNLSFALRTAGMKRAEIDSRIARAAAMLQIEPLLKRKPIALSGGQRQRVAIGRALVRDVDVYLFDEPLSNLDAKLRSELRLEIKRLHRQLSSTMIYVTHDQVEAMTLADRIAVMKGGEIQQLDTPQTIYNRPCNRFVASFIGASAMNMFEGRIEDGGEGAVFRGPNVSASLRDYQSSGVLEAGRDAFLGVRPEHIRLGGEAGDASVTLEATVEFVEPMGADALVWLEVGGRRCSARVDANRGFRAGDAAPMHIDMRLASLFDSETERRL